MSFLLITVFFLIVTARAENFLWLLLPVSLIADFWQLKGLGTTGLKVLLICGIFWLVLGFRRADCSKLSL